MQCIKTDSWVACEILKHADTPPEDPRVLQEIRPTDYSLNRKQMSSHRRVLPGGKPAHELHTARMVRTPSDGASTAPPSQPQIEVKKPSTGNPRHLDSPSKPPTIPSTPRPSQAEQPVTPLAPRSVSASQDGLTVGPPTLFRSSQHQLQRRRYASSQEARGYFEVWEYTVPNVGTFAVNADDGYVHWTSLARAAGVTKGECMPILCCARRNY